jgi:SAM-dependent methyltransferase
LINRIYRKVRRRTLREKRRTIRKFTGLHRGSLLDIGSGTGAFANEMRKAAWEVTGLEPVEEAREAAWKNHEIRLEPAEKINTLPGSAFDVITLWHVLEHVHDLHVYLDRLRDMLKENGKMFIAVPNYTSLDAGVYKEYWAAYDVPRHLYHFSPGSMKRLLERHGFRLLDLKPMWYDSFYISLLSSRYLHGRSRVPGALWNGLRSNLRAIGNTERCSSVLYIAERGQ